MKPFRTFLLALALPALGVRGMDRLDALSQIESHDNDHAIGPQQEVSRYQILPAFWAQARTWNLTDGGDLRPTDAAIAKIVVDRIMRVRCRAFTARYHRAPTDFEYYLLWHRPACFVGRATPRPITVAEADRGRRFARLCQSQ